MEQQKKRKKIWIAMGSILVFLLIVLGTVVGLALSDPYSGTVKAAAQPENVVAKLADSLLSGESTLLTKEEVSGLLAAQVTNRQGGGFQILDFQCVSTGNEDAEFYIPVSRGGLHLAVSARMKVGCDTANQTLWAEVQSVKLGRLPIKAEWAMSAVRKLLPDTVTVEGNKISVPSSFFNDRILGGTVGLTVTGLQTAPSGFLVQVTGNTERLQNNFEQYLQGFLNPGD